MRIIAGIIFGCLTLTTTAAMAETTGNLYEQCLNFPRKQYLYKYCLGYMAGVHDIINIKREILKCGPTDLPSLSNATLTEKFVSWARKNPSEWERPAFDGMIKMIDENYPCPNPDYDYSRENPVNE